MCMPNLRTIYETCRSRGPLKQPWFSLLSETRQTSIFLFYSLYTAILTKNKFRTFPARLIPPGSRSIKNSAQYMAAGQKAKKILVYIKNVFHYRNKRTMLAICMELYTTIAQVWWPVLVPNQAGRRRASQKGGGSSFQAGPHDLPQVVSEETSWSWLFNPRAKDASRPAHWDL